MRLEKCERETIIRYDEADNMASLYTASSSMIRKMDTLCEQHPDSYRCTRRDQYGAEYSFPKKSVKLAKPVSEKQRENNRRLALQYGFKSGEIAASSSQETE